MGPMVMEAVAPVISASQLAPIADTINSNAAVLIPVGIGVMAIMVGIKIIPRIINNFI